MVFILDSPKRHNLKVNGYYIFDTYDINVSNGERKKGGRYVARKEVYLMMTEIERRKD